MYDLQPFPNSNIRVSYSNISSDPIAIFPRIEVELNILYTYSGPESRTICLSDFGINLRLERGDERYLIGTLTLDTSYIVLNPSNNYRLATFLDLDFYRLHQIEKLREGGNLMLQVTGHFYAEIKGEHNKNLCYFNFNFKVPKSQWVEDILNKTGFKDVSLLEIPKLPTEEYRDVVGCVDNAWKQYMMGEYDKVLGDCRKALEGLTKIVRGKGFEKTITENDKKSVVPDWGKFFGNEDLGDIFGSITQKMFGFTSVGAHFGKGINREDADLALMIAHSMTNYVIKKTPTIAK